MAKHLNVNDAARAFMKETFENASSKPYSSDLATTMTQIAELYEEGLTEEQKASIPTGGDYNALADAFYRMVKTMSLSGGNDALVVRLFRYPIGSDSEYEYYSHTCDLDFDEVSAAYQSGKNVVFYFGEFDIETDPYSGDQRGIPEYHTVVASAENVPGVSRSLNRLYYSSDGRDKYTGGNMAKYAGEDENGKLFVLETVTKEI